MKSQIGVLLAMLLMPLQLFADGYELKGKITDKNKEPLVGATVVIEGTTEGTIAGLDGTFKIKELEPGQYTFTISFIGCKQEKHTIKIFNDEEINIVLDEDDMLMGEVMVTASQIKSTISSARATEKMSPKVVNVVSGKAIELSPDLNVSEVVQRISGVSLEYSGSGTGTYAIVRGMDKRYNYTTVNGVKIPSPDNKNRFVPLDMFPSDMLDRIEVSKALIPSMEGDAVGGAMDLIMKNAPDQEMWQVNASVGMATLFMERDFEYFNYSAVNPQSPYEIHGKDYSASMDDFSTENLVKQYKRNPIDINAGLTWGNRFLDHRFGIVLSGNIQHLHRGSNTSFYNQQLNRDASNSISLTHYSDRLYSSEQLRGGAHGKLDFAINGKNKLSLYTAFIYQRDDEIREETKFRMWDGNYDPITTTGNASLETRIRPTVQSIYNTTLQGKHELNDVFSFDWSAVYSIATGARPDQSIFTRNTAFRDGDMTQVRVEDYGGNYRIWEDNSDRDLSAYLNLNIKPWEHTDLKVGVLYRDKKRENRFYRYNFRPQNDEIKEGEDWIYTEVDWRVTSPKGSVANELNYDAYEKIAAGYFQFDSKIGENLKLFGGIRVEHTRQGYELLFPKYEQEPTLEQNYIDLLPSLHAKYELNKKSNLRASYFHSIVRPGFFEIVPYTFRYEDYDEIGNPDLERTRADNIDLRYELFPSPQDNVFVGAFYKRLYDPIEYALVPIESRQNAIFLQPGNYGTATNMGIELDVTKYIKNWGIKANYTYTNSSITTSKVLLKREDENDSESDIVPYQIDQTRPLQGQADHIGNITLLYKNQQLALDMQLANVYTGERISEISAYYEKDLWELPTWKMDFSAEKHFNMGVTLFLKLRNILDTSRQIVIKEPLKETETDYILQGKAGDDKLIRYDKYGQNFLIGLRYKF